MSPGRLVEVRDMGAILQRTSGARIRPFDADKKGRRDAILSGADMRRAK